VSQVVKVERKRTEEKIVNEKTKSLVGLKEKLLCLSIVLQNRSMVGWAVRRLLVSWFMHHLIMELAREKLIN